MAFKIDPVTGRYFTPEMDRADPARSFRDLCGAPQEPGPKGMSCDATSYPLSDVESVASEPKDRTPSVVRHPLHELDYGPLELRIMTQVMRDHGLKIDQGALDRYAQKLNEWDAQVERVEQARRPLPEKPEFLKLDKELRVRVDDIESYQVVTKECIDGEEIELRMYTMGNTEGWYSVKGEKATVLCHLLDHWLGAVDVEDLL
jgi:hypothetical protein